MGGRGFDSFVCGQRGFAQADVLAGRFSRVPGAVEPVADASVGSEDMGEGAGAGHFAAVQLGDRIELRVAT